MSSACHASEPLPSRGLEVSLSTAKVDAFAVAAKAGSYLERKGLKQLGKSGYDELRGATTSLTFGSPDHVSVSIALDRPGIVPIRIDASADDLPLEANDLFLGLKRELERQWPDAVTEVP